METKNTYQIVEVALLVLALMFITSGCERSLTNSTASAPEGPDQNQSSKYLDAVREFADNRSAQYSFKDTVPDVIIASQSTANLEFGCRSLMEKFLVISLVKLFF